MGAARQDRPIELDLADIQGNLLTAYGRQGFPKGRYLVFHVARAEEGRRFIRALFPRVTTALRWPSSKGIPTGAVVPERPLVALNLAFTFRGLLALGLPVRSLRGLPDEFIDGMAARAAVLGDDFGPNRVEHWDPVWAREDAPDQRVHMLVTLNAQMEADGTPVAALDQVTDELLALCAASDGGVRLLEGHRGREPRWQDLSAMLGDVGGRLTPLPVEHFGLTDGIGDPVFAGQFPAETEAERVVGNGKLTPAGGGAPSWAPLATGEFLLGYPDEAQEIAGFAMPEALSRNGTFMAYRKLHQDVRAWNGWVDRTAVAFGRTFGIDDPAIARSTLIAKMSGRWAEDGVPITLAPTWADRAAFNARLPVEDRKRPQALSAFTYFDDPDGVKCPLTAHMRRANPRDMLDPLGPVSRAAGYAPSGSVLNNRRRILRRGLPYGPDRVGEAAAEDEQGIVMLNVCASLFRQFEFVQQQWMNYGLDFNAGNDTCPIVGNHDQAAKFVVAAARGAGHPPFIADRLPNFVTTRGGAYFFVPSMTALRMIGMGVVDPT